MVSNVDRLQQQEWPDNENFHKLMQGRDMSLPIVGYFKTGGLQGNDSVVI